MGGRNAQKVDIPKPPKSFFFGHLPYFCQKKRFSRKGFLRAVFLLFELFWLHFAPSRCKGRLPEGSLSRGGIVVTTADNLGSFRLFSTTFIFRRQMFDQRPHTGNPRLPEKKEGNQDDGRKAPEKMHPFSTRSLCRLLRKAALNTNTIRIGFEKK